MFLAQNKALLKAFKAGDRDAMETVYKHYFPGVTSFLRKGFTFRSGKGQFFYKGIQDPSDLRSAVQEVFRRAFEHKARTSYNGINSFTNWVLAIGRNMVINQFRNREIAFSQYVRPTDDRPLFSIMDDEVTEEYSGVLYGRASKSAQTEVENVELKNLMDKFMEGLTEHDQKLMVFRFVENMGQEEAAAALGSTRMKVRTAEKKVRSRLRAFLRDSGYLDGIGK